MSTKTLEETSLCGVWENVLREEHLKHHRVLTLRVRNVASYSEAASSRVCCSSTTPLTSGSRERCFARTDSLAASPIPRCRLQVPSRRMALVCYHGNGSPGTDRCNHRRSGAPRVVEALRMVRFSVHHGPSETRSACIRHDPVASYWYQLLYTKYPPPPNTHTRAQRPTIPQVSGTALVRVDREGTGGSMPREGSERWAASFHLTELARWKRVG
jgi:hypothetical protein